jgi:hypothetical protein
MTMKNKALLADTQLFSQYARSYINEEFMLAGYRKTEYAEGDLLLDIIKEGLVTKHIATAIVNIVDIVQHLAACQRVGQPAQRVAGGIEAKEVTC